MQDNRSMSQLLLPKKRKEQKKCTSTTLLAQTNYEWKSAEAFLWHTHNKEEIWKYELKCIRPKEKTKKTKRTACHSKKAARTRHNK